MLSVIVDRPLVRNVYGVKPPLYLYTCRLQASLSIQDFKMRPGTRLAEHARIFHPFDGYNIIIEILSCVDGNDLLVAESIGN